MNDWFRKPGFVPERQGWARPTTAAIVRNAVRLPTFVFAKETNMGFARMAVLGALGYGIYHYLGRPKALPAGTRTHDGIAAIYATREAADLAVEHLVQARGVDRSFIYLEPVEDSNSAGAQVSGGDASSGDEGSRERTDAPLNGAIRLTVAASDGELALLRVALKEAGATEVRAF
jgi:hypothetical protein